MPRSRGLAQEHGPDAEDADEQDQHCRRFRHIVRGGRRERRTLGVHGWVAGRGPWRNDAARRNKAGIVEGRDIGRRPGGRRRREYGVGLNRCRNAGSSRNPPWLPRDRRVAGEPRRNRAGA